MSKKTSKRLTKREYSNKYKISLAALRWAREKNTVSCELVNGEYLYDDIAPHNNTMKRQGWANCIEKISDNEFYINGEIIGACGIELPVKAKIIEIKGTTYLGLFINGEWDFQEV